MNNQIKILIILLLLLPAGELVFAQGGPPMLIDDPVTVDKGHWEINNAFILEHTANSDEFELSLEDFNYGLTDNIHIKLEVPIIFKHNTGTPLIAGLGKSNVGAKIRFYNDEKNNVSFSTFPQVSFNNLSSSSERGITEEGIEFLLPLSIMKEFGKSAVILEIGRGFASRDQGNWIYGSLYNYRISKKVEIAAELFGNSDYHFTGSEIFFNAGVRIKLNKHFNILFSAGNNFVYHSTGENKFIGYFALQLDL